ncbi:hypothetical protein AVEN_174061-1 [Araneus ventricosus]|uniref:Uncharacterized protein n=1 Tax=Araneus ventricosus TaxID=182803 RepID=A0A4Y2C3Q1_ARAVE|nr:hypothetical protein AVEN_174061-1 [Araneus ventricosus]
MPFYKLINTPSLNSMVAVRPCLNQPNCISFFSGEESDQSEKKLVDQTKKQNPELGPEMVQQIRRDDGNFNSGLEMRSFDEQWTELGM